MNLHLREEKLEDLREEWDDLLLRSPYPTVFETPAWHSIWWEEFSGEARLHIIAGRENNRLIGIAPFMFNGNDRLMFVGDTDLWDYHKVIVENSKMEEFFSSLLAYINQLKWAVMDFSSLQETSETYQGILAMVEKAELEFDVNREGVSPGIKLPGTWDEYLANLNKKNRHELRRKIRKLESEASFKWFSVDVNPSSNEALSDFFSLMRESRHDKAMFLTPERERFFRRIARAMGEAGYLKLFFMEIDGQRVAAVWCFDMGNVRYLYNSGFNPAFGHLSVGLLLKAFCLKDAIETGMDYFDFLRGDERYKYDLGAQDVVLYNMVVSR